MADKFNKSYDTEQRKRDKRWAEANGLANSMVDGIMSNHIILVGNTMNNQDKHRKELVFGLAQLLVGLISLIENDRRFRITFTEYKEE